jgi:endo-alpha-1,4-polygalactosaminidase (GH114 family)
VENSLFKNSLPSHIQELIKTKRRTRSRWQRHNLPSNKCILNNLTNVIKKQVQKHKSKFFEEKYQSLNTKDGSLWKITKNIFKVEVQYTPLNDPNGHLVISDKNKADLFGNHFSKTFTPHFNIILNLEHLDEIKNFLGRQPIAYVPSHKAHNYKRYIINKLKVGNSPGYDLI